MASPSVVILDAFRDEREMYAEYFRVSGFRVRAFYDADAAFEDAIKHVPDLVVCRLRSASLAEPGATFTARLRASAATRRVPVLVLSTTIDMESREEALAQGADGYLLLPCLPAKLLAEARRLLKRESRSRRDAAGGRRQVTKSKATRPGVQRARSR